MRIVGQVKSPVEHHIEYDKCLKRVFQHWQKTKQNTQLNETSQERNQSISTVESIVPNKGGKEEKHQPHHHFL